MPNCKIPCQVTMDLHELYADQPEKNCLMSLSRATRTIEENPDKYSELVTWLNKFVPDIQKQFLSHAISKSGLTIYRRGRGKGRETIWKLPERRQ